MRTRDLRWYVHPSDEDEGTWFWYIMERRPGRDNEQIAEGRAASQTEAAADAGAACDKLRDAPISMEELVALLDGFLEAHQKQVAELRRQLASATGNDEGTSHERR